MGKHYNIMTSSDTKLIKQIEILVYSIARNLKDASVDFYFFHRGIESEKLRGMYQIAEIFQNIVLHSITVSDVEFYDYLAAQGGGWAGEAYFSLCAHELLPSNVDRILYLDAGDILVVDDIELFYNTDFEDNYLIVSNIRLYDENCEPRIFKREDMEVTEKLVQMADSTFNSGSYIMNIAKLRSEQRSRESYMDIVEMLRQKLGQGNQNIYFGDQGLLSVCFVGKIKYWGYPECKFLPSSPYNFMMGWYSIIGKKPPFCPAIIHFVGQCKPWMVNYPIQLEEFDFGQNLTELSDMALGQAEWYYLWHEYALIVDAIVNGAS